MIFFIFKRVNRNNAFLSRRKCLAQKEYNRCINYTFKNVMQILIDCWFPLITVKFP